jgi:hypothetical protein
MLNLGAEIRERDDECLQEFLAMTLGHVKSLHAALTGLMTDMAALRKTILEEPEDLAQYQANLRVAVETAKPLVDEAMRSYDEMIQVLSSSERWAN